jgi:hypothetical protein
MNRLEQRYADHLEAKRQAGEVLEWHFEPETLQLAHGCAYRPDFRVVGQDGVVCFHEVKGYKRPLGMAKLKIAAELHPYAFYLVQVRRKRDGGGWAITRIRPRGCEDDGVRVEGAACA